MDGPHGNPRSAGTADGGTASEHAVRAPRVPSLDALVAGTDRDGGDRAVDCVLSDVWGVLHNGVSAHAHAAGALRGARERGAAVVLVTNSPRPREGVAAQLEAIGVPREAYDRIVTSGDVTRRLIAAVPGPVCHLGPRRDLPLYEGTGASPRAEAEAEAIVCTGLVDDESEEPGDYAGRLEGLAKRDLPMIVANPDIVVERGDRLVWCAGALGRLYRELGGETRIAGKPHAPIYAAALAEAAEVLGHAPSRERTLAIGDGMPTDVRGALDAGLPLLFVAGGIHAAEYGGAEADPARLEAFLASEGGRPTPAGGRIVGWMPHLG